MASGTPVVPITPKDEVVTFLDFGPSGNSAKVILNLTEGLKPGGIINAVLRTDVKQISINIMDAQGNVLLHVVSRVTEENSFALNSYLDGVWGPEVGITPVPTEKNTKFVATIVYEQAGYRIFINGTDIGFYHHRCATPPVLVEIHGGVVYKALYVSWTNMPDAVEA